MFKQTPTGTGFYKVSPTHANILTYTWHTNMCDPDTEANKTARSHANKLAGMCD